MFSTENTGFAQKLRNGLKAFIPRLLVLLLLFICFRIFEVVYDSILHGAAAGFWQVLFTGLLKDIAVLFTIAPVIGLLYLAVYLLSSKAANIFFTITATLLCLIQVALIQYFQTTLVPLGGDLWGYTMADIRQTVGAAGIKVSVIIVLILALAAIIFLLIWLPSKIKLPALVVYLLALISLITIGTGIVNNIAGIHLKNEYANSLSIDKSWFFYTESWKHFFPEDNDLDIYADSYIGDYGDEAGGAAIQSFQYVDENNYPFLHEDKTADVLSPFMDSAAVRPNIVILIVEGLGRAFTNEGAYLGNFTPFVDSLSQHSLYWQNCLSGGGRTFAVLPTLLGSLPFGKNGFASLGDAMPQHHSLLSLLQYNGYNTSFYYGGDSHFDNMNLFLQKGNINRINDISSFPSGYVKLPASSAGFSWGYGDKEMFRWYFQSHPPLNQPHASVLLTVATHSPFMVNDQQQYLDRFEQRLNEIKFNEEEKQRARNYKMQYASVLYTDDAIRSFFSNYAKRPDYANTIFVITGDHQMPELPMNNKLDRYHVPLILFSPLLKRTATFSALASHFDVTPSLLSLIKQRYHIKTPAVASWVGNGLDTARSFRNQHAYPLMQTKNDLVDFIMGNNMINESSLFDVDAKLELTGSNNTDIYNRLKGSFDRFKQKNNAMINGAKLIPDSAYTAYHPVK